MTRWGIVSTIKAPRDEVLDFAAYHIERGAHRLSLFLDAPDDDLAEVLTAHPLVDVVQCDADWWRARGGRPAKHQVRQVRNAQYALDHAQDIDWLAHIDVDEFLWSERVISHVLKDLPQECLCVRVRPIEGLAGAPELFKAFHRDHAARSQAARRLYPVFGHYLRGGFVSHIAGKLFVRTNHPGLQLKIHNVRQGEADNPGQVQLDDLDLCHVHARSWEAWRAHFTYRHDKGSYRAELKGRGTLTPHELFAGILQSDGEAGLRAFFDEVCAATPSHVAGLEREGLLRRRDLRLRAARMRHFPAA
ncbi:glycosyltransferase family 2 protein [Primorskyibacter sp. S187A]|uniref:glycosyltransferase family 2 protein n=1 Tax=Primorskyibacter sp. S187A TaxID=3415130 RepID=UPI003C7D136D